MTEKQRKVLAFIRSFIQSERRPPTIREIAAHFRYASNRTVQDYLAALERKGFLKVLKGLSRGIDLTAQAIGIPVVGRVPAGVPFFAEENVEQWLDLSLGYFKGGEPLDRIGGRVFALRVVGDSMEGAGIVDGDLVIVRKQPSASHRDIVVALVNGQATVKRLTEKGERRTLLPENPKYAPIPLGADSAILGKVLGVVRRY